jgi:hypothetical protein
MILERDEKTKSEIPEDEYIKDVLLVGIAIGKAPSSVEYKEKGRFSPRSGRRKFGSWDATLGMVCSEVFELRPALEYLANLASELQEGRQYLVSPSEFQKKTNIKIKPYELESARIEANINNNEEKIDEKTACDHFQKYHENWAQPEEKVGLGFIRKMSNIFKVDEGQYLRHFSTFIEAERKSNLRPSYMIEGRGSREKLDEFIKIADMDRVQSIDMEDIPAPNTTIISINSQIREHLPEKFFNTEI